MSFFGVLWSGFSIKVVVDPEQLKVNQSRLQKQGVVQMGNVCPSFTEEPRQAGVGVGGGCSIEFSCVDYTLFLLIKVMLLY